MECLWPARVPTPRLASLFTLIFLLFFIFASSFCIYRFIIHFPEDFIGEKRIYLGPSWVRILPKPQMKELERTSPSVLPPRDVSIQSFSFSTLRISPFLQGSFRMLRGAIVGKRLRIQHLLTRGQIKAPQQAGSYVTGCLLSPLTPLLLACSLLGPEHLTIECEWLRTQRHELDRHVAYSPIIGGEEREENTWGKTGGCKLYWDWQETKTQTII